MDTDQLRDRLRASAPSDLGRTVITRDIGGVKLSLQVSPGSWMYPGYGLQVEITMAGGGNAYLLDKATPFAKATHTDLERLFDRVKVISCCKCGKPAFDPASIDTNREGKCESCFMEEWSADYAKLQEAELAKLKKKDQEMKSNGYTHRVTAWIHGDGDDEEVHIYMRTTPIDAQIRNELRSRGSQVLDDYEVSAL